MRALAVALLVACLSGRSSSGEAPAGEGSGPDGGRDGLDLESRPRGAYHVVRRTCDEQVFTEDFEVEPLATCVHQSGVAQPECDSIVECLGPEDCTARPFGRCLGIDLSECLNPDGTPAEISCQTDADCARVAGGRCKKAFAVLGCQYDDACARNADCPQGHRCACGGSGDLGCYPAQCLDDGDCGAGQRCRRAHGCTGGLTGAFFCTTPLDLCASDDDCAGADAGAHDCDRVDAGWACTSVARCVLP
jgi:Cys-rich repeat protein